MIRGLAITAPATGAGKTVLSLGIMRALSNRKMRVAPAKCGPDYIDPQYHALACGSPSFNLDPWAMDAPLVRSLVASAADDSENRILVVEGAMGVLDGAGKDGSGSTAHLASLLGLPLIMVVDVRGQSHSSALAPVGLRALKPEIELAGVILNRVGSVRHEAMVRSSLEARGVAVFGAVPRDGELELPSRHLGLVPAGEHEGIESFLSAAAAAVERNVDLAKVAAAAEVPILNGGIRQDFGIPPLGQRIAVARDEAFVFAYSHLVDGWRRAGAELRFFSPLADSGPCEGCDSVFLPGGYPELHAGRLASCRSFKAGMRASVEKGAVVYGECGGYMVLGDGLEDACGARHAMLGLLPVETTFRDRRLCLGYRDLVAESEAPFKGSFKGHEFHYARISATGSAPSLFSASDSFGEDLGGIGHVAGRVSGSFAHLICAPGA